MGFRDDQKNQVQQLTDIVALVGEHVSLRARGREFLGLCPFHDDKNPSMHVSPAKQIYKCFSCGAGGDVFSFMMAYHKMTFPEALKHLADRAGVKLTRGSGSGERGAGEQEQEEGPTERELLSEAHAKATGFFRAVLRHSEHGKVAREYLERRRINAAMIEQFQIGYAPDRWDGLVMMLREKRWDLPSFERAGLLMRRQGEGSDAAAPDPQPPTPNPQTLNHYDRFRHRLIFPICDALGRPIAFGGRKLREEDEPKYLNSPEHPLFNKSATLYGLHLAKKAIIDSRTAVIVEGYTDVIACHQAGVRNVVATLGTALTSQHAAQLRRYADKVVLIFDADEAGIKAADRAVEIFFNDSLDVAVAILPDEADPAELFEQPDGLAKWNAAVAQATDALTYQLERLRGRIEGQDTITGRQRLAEDYLRTLANLGFQKTSAIRKGMILARLAEMLKLSESDVDATLRRLAPASRPTNATAGQDGQTLRGAVRSGSDLPQPLDPAVASSQSGARLRGVRLAEKHLIGCLIQRPVLLHTALPEGRALDEAVQPTELLWPDTRDLAQILYDALPHQPTLTLKQLLAELAARGRQDLCDLATAAEDEVDRCAAGDESKLRDLLAQAARCVRDFHAQRDYEAQRREALDDEQDGGLKLKRILEQQRSRPSTLRIARVRT